MSTLTATIDTNSIYPIYVTDSEGGVWWPSEEAAAEILAAEDPEATAIRIVTTDPMRGEWKF